MKVYGSVNYAEGPPNLFGGDPDPYPTSEYGSKSWKFLEDN